MLLLVHYIFSPVVVWVEPSLVGVFAVLVLAGVGAVFVFTGVTNVMSMLYVYGGVWDTQRHRLRSSSRRAQVKDSRALDQLFIENMFYLF